MLVALYTHRDNYASDSHHRYTFKFYLPFTCKFVLENQVKLMFSFILAMCRCFSFYF